MKEDLSEKKDSDFIYNDNLWNNTLVPPIQSTVLVPPPQPRFSDIPTTPAGKRIRTTSKTQTELPPLSAIPGFLGNSVISENLVNPSGFMEFKGGLSVSSPPSVKGHRQVPIYDVGGTGRGDHQAGRRGSSSSSSHSHSQEMPKRKPPSTSSELTLYTSPKWRKGKLWVAVSLAFIQGFQIMESDIIVCYTEDQIRQNKINEKDPRKVIIYFKYKVVEHDKKISKPLGDLMAISPGEISWNYKDSQVRLRFTCIKGKTNLAPEHFFSDSTPNKVAARNYSTFVKAKIVHNQSVTKQEIGLCWGNKDRKETKRPKKRSNEELASDDMGNTPPSSASNSSSQSPVSSPPARSPPHNTSLEQINYQSPFITMGSSHQYNPTSSGYSFPPRPQSSPNIFTENPQQFVSPDVNLQSLSFPNFPVRGLPPQQFTQQHNTWEFLQYQHPGTVGHSIVNTPTGPGFGMGDGGMGMTTLYYPIPSESSDTVFCFNDNDSVFSLLEALGKQLSVNADKEKQIFNSIGIHTIDQLRNYFRNNRLNNLDLGSRVKWRLEKLIEGTQTQDYASRSIRIQTDSKNYLSQISPRYNLVGGNRDVVIHAAIETSPGFFKWTAQDDPSRCFTATPIEYITNDMDGLHFIKLLHPVPDDYPGLYNVSYVDSNSLEWRLYGPGETKTNPSSVRVDHMHGHQNYLNDSPIWRDQTNPSSMEFIPEDESYPPDSYHHAFTVLDNWAILDRVFKRTMGDTTEHPGTYPMDPYDRTLAHYAASLGEMDILMRVAERGDDISIRDQIGRTPFYYAVWNGHLTVVKYLIRLVPKLKFIGDYDGITPLHLAGRAAYEDIVRVLLDPPKEQETVSAESTPVKNTFLEGPSPVEDTPSEASSVEGTPLKSTPEKLPLSMESTPQKDSLNEDNQKLFRKANTEMETPLFWAVSSGSLVIVKLMVEMGAPLTHLNDDGINIYDFARKKRKKAIALYLEQKIKERKLAFTRPLHLIPAFPSDEATSTPQMTITVSPKRTENIEKSLFIVAETEIDLFIQGFLIGKQRVLSKGDNPLESLVVALEPTLRIIRIQSTHLRDISAWTSAKKNVGSPKFLLRSFVQLFSVRVVVLSYDFEKQVVVKIKYFKNKHEADVVYLAFNGWRYDAILNIPSSLFEVIRDQETSAEDLQLIVKNIESSQINITHKIEEEKLVCTPFYYACMKGRTDLVRVLLTCRGIVIDGNQEKMSGNNPLYVAFWNGYTNIVAILLYLKVKPKRQDKLGHTLLMNNSLGKSTIDCLTKLLNTCGSFAENNNNLIQFGKNFLIEEIPPLITSEILFQAAPLLETVCSTLASVNPPSPEEFRNILTLDSEINNYSRIYKCSALYMASLRGHLGLIKEMVNVYGDKLKLSGPQEDITPHGNSPIEIATWYGHVQVVAFLMLELTSKGIFTQRPKMNHLLPIDTQSALDSIWRMPIDTPLLKMHAYSEPARRIFHMNSPLPLVYYLSSSWWSVPPLYNKLPYDWFVEVADGSDLKRLPLHMSTQLVLEYNRYLREGSTKPEITCNCPVPSDDGGWNYESLDVNFQESTIRCRSLELVVKPGTLVVRERPSTYLWKSKKGNWKVFPPKGNRAISSGKYHNRNSAEFTLRKGVRCVVDLVEMKVTLLRSTKDPVTYNIIIDNEYEKKSWSDFSELYWEHYYNNYTSTGLIMVPLDFNSTDELDKEELNMVLDSFYRTMSNNNKIIKVSRVLNREMNDLREQSILTIRNTQSSNPVRLLWHGTENINPMDLCSQGSINPTNRKDIQFSADASYSAESAYTDPENGQKSMILAQVLVGEVYYAPENSHVTEPPMGYNSVMSWISGSWVNMVYGKHLAFPTYVVDWENNGV